MSWPRDDVKLERVRALMAEHELDPLVVRAPDNVLYLTNFWGMKGYDAVVFPARRRPDADLPRAFRRRRGADGLDERRPPLRRLRPGRPQAATLRALDIARGLAEDGGAGAQPRHAGDRPDGRRADNLPEGVVRRVAGCPRRVPAARRGARDQDRAGDRRMRLANEIAAAAIEHVQGVLRPGMTRAGGGRVAGLRPRRGHRLEGPGGPGAAVLACLVRPEHQHVHRHHRRPDRRGTSRPCSRSGSARTATGPTTPRTSAPVCSPSATRNCSPRSRRSTTTPSRSAGRARASPSSTAGFGTESTPPATPASRATRSATGSAPARTSRRTRTRPAAARSAKAWCWRSSPGSTGRGAAACGSRTTS